MKSALPINKINMKLVPRYNNVNKCITKHLIAFFSGKMLLAKPSNQNVPSTSPPQASAFFSDLTNCFFLRSDKTHVALEPSQLIYIAIFCYRHLFEKRMLLFI